MKIFFLFCNSKFFEKNNKTEIPKEKKIMSKNTLNGTKRKAQKVSGFRARNASKTGRKVLKKRRMKGRWKLTNF